MSMKIKGNNNVQVHFNEFNINTISSDQQCHGNQQIDLTLFTDKQLKDVKRKLRNERIKILFSALSQKDIKRVFFGYFIFIFILNCIPRFSNEYDVELSSFVLNIGIAVGILGAFILWASWLCKKMSFSNKAIDVLFKVNQRKQDIIEKELQRRFNEYWARKCGIKKDILEYFDND
ncbi:hypothetical protein [Pasteurella multocida]|uniref:hypothetical protein n=1 Tax=Pasteurella multocida TaxID=747 RepID=UPI000517F730|nr:hypothetical protein [Pasteurella multocida]ARB74183.1 hypothetical protein A6J55_08285 [Pasteurella multocida]MCL7790008.1 hypothetical protein [Pasteurella multocida]OBP29191.1 hypothetical protein A0R63_01020 [Pasteurella multocida subsp. multocida]URH93406.1 hypothetical protein M8850_07555 [Pasteurella multocida]URH99779.1 hypothetical protein M8851_07660 [Pasteurella multocida]